MATIVNLVVLTSIIICTLGAPIQSDMDYYKQQRSDLISSEQCMRIGADTVLNNQESILNQFIMKEKRQLMEASRHNRTGYIPAVSFYESKTWIEATPIFKIIKAMPKGASLHIHDLAIGSLDWVIYNATYRSNVYMCTDKSNFILLSIFQNAPNNPDSPWRLVGSVRNSSGNAIEFDKNLKQNISLLTTDPLKTYPSVDLVWNRFNKYFEQVAGLLTNAPIMRDYFRHALEEFKADNVQYVEMRGQIAGLTEIDGTIHDGEYGVNLYKQVTDEFVQKYPKDFSGAKIIMSSMRFKSKTEIQNDVAVATDLYSKFPNYFLGYDLVGQEDPNYPLIYYIEELLAPNQNQKVRLPYFFHAGETKWQGTDVDYNLVDALLLNTTRIGHGYALGKHPKLVELVKSKGIAVEVNPLSNQLLGLVSDLRNHAMTPLLAQNIPIVISSDDPGSWESLPLSHDFYAAFMDLTGQDSDLTVLKQLAINSIKYSAMNNSEKDTAMKLWQTKWDMFVNNMVTTLNLKADDSIASDSKPKCPKQMIGASTTNADSGTALSTLPITVVISMLLNAIIGLL